MGDWRSTRSERRRAGLAAMEEFGFEAVGPGKARGPSPGRIADRLCDALVRLQQSRGERNRKGLAAGIAERDRLLLALDTWDVLMLEEDMRAERREMRRRR